jgi:hypothetical protein
VLDGIYHAVKEKEFQKIKFLGNFHTNLLAAFHVFFKDSDWLKAAWKAAAVGMKLLG